jgi:hypothetical protein
MDTIRASRFRMPEQKDGNCFVGFSPEGYAKLEIGGVLSMFSWEERAADRATLLRCVGLTEEAPLYLAASTNRNLLGVTAADAATPFSIEGCGLADGLHTLEAGCRVALVSNGLYVSAAQGALRLVAARDASTDFLHDVQEFTPTQISIGRTVTRGIFHLVNWIRPKPLPIDPLPSIITEVNIGTA